MITSEVTETWEIITRIPEADDWEAQELCHPVSSRQKAAEALTQPVGTYYPAGTTRVAMRRLVVTISEELTP